MESEKETTVESKSREEPAPSKGKERSGDEEKNGNGTSDAAKDMSKLRAALLTYMKGTFSGKHIAARSRAVSTGSAIRQWAQNLRTTSLLYNSTGYNWVDGYPECYFGTVCATAEGGGIITSEVYTLVSSTGGGMNTPLDYAPAIRKLIDAFKVSDTLTVSQFMRIKTNITDGDAITKALVGITHVVDSNTGGAFTGEVVRALLYIYQYLPLTGPENTDVGGVHPVLQQPMGAGLGNVYWPLGADAAGPLVMNCGICTYSEFASVRYGNAHFGNAVGFGPAGWGTECAVVPILPEDLGRPDLVASKILVRMEYPWVNVEHILLTQDSAGLNIGGNSVLHPASANVRVTGAQPQANGNINVLLVLCGFTNNAVGPIQVEVSSANQAVVQYPTNSPALGVFVPVDIFPALAAFAADPGFVTGGMTSSIEQWCRCVGSEEDWNTAIAVAADVGHQIPAPAVKVDSTVFGGLNRGGDISTYWNSTDFEEPTVATIGVKSEARTCPLQQMTETARDNIANERRTTLRIGVTSPLVEVDMFEGLYVARNKMEVKPVYTPYTLMCMLRECARCQSQYFDVLAYDLGISANVLWNAPGYVGNQGGSSALVANRWRMLSSVITQDLATIGAKNLAYEFASLQDMQKDYWANVVGGTVDIGDGERPLYMGYARVPKHIMSFMGLWQPPGDNKSLVLGNYHTSLGFPEARDIYSVVQVINPQFHEEAAVGFQKLTAVDGIWPEDRPESEYCVSQPNGGSVGYYGICTTIPSYSRCAALTLGNYGARGQSSDFVNPPLFPAFPFFSDSEGIDLRMGYYGNMTGDLDRAEVRLYYSSLMKTTMTARNAVRNDSTTDAASGRFSGYFRT